MDLWHFIADRKIEEAMKDGAFDFLEGMGKTLDLSENPFEDPGDRMANRLLKKNGFAPDWIEEAKSIREEAARLGLDASPQDRERIKNRLRDLQLRIPDSVRNYLSSENG